MLYIIRGIPGSGKSTLAKQLLADNLIDDYFEADMYFERNGRYQFNSLEIQKAHQWCFQRTKQALGKGRNVAVSNTFTRKWEYERYFDLVDDVMIITCTGNYQNVHGVPEEVVKKMAARFEA